MNRTAAPMWKLTVVLFVFLSISLPAHAQVDYSVRFEMEKPQDLLGEPIFCRFVIRNTGSQVFAFRYRTPSRNLATDNDQEPRFTVMGAQGRRLPDPGPRPCGNPQGTAVYGSVTLPPGQVHTERWLLNQWARFDSPGAYHVRAERRLALLAPALQEGTFTGNPLAYALAIDELSLQVTRATGAQVAEAYRPYLAALDNAKNPNPAEAVVVLTSLPQPFFLDKLVAMANAVSSNRWDRRDALDGLARLNTPASWDAILNLIRGSDTSASSTNAAGAARAESNSLRSYALLLLAEKGDPLFIPPFLHVLAKSADPLRGDILRALGFFHDARVYQPLFDNLHSTQATDRMNAILGLKTLGSKEVVPALIAALDDPEAQVRQVANFALEGLTQHKVTEATHPSSSDPQRIAGGWHAWWREHAATFSPPPPAACHDW